MHDSIPKPVPEARGIPLLRLGFRPFYLLAAAFGAVAMPLWWCVFTGEFRLPAPLAPVWWHAHEMTFGFVGAVVIGFLLTAGRAWTGLATPRGPALAALAALWLAARVAALFAPYTWFVLLDVPLLPVVAAIFARVLVRAGNSRNAGPAVVLMVLAGANVLFHLSVIGGAADPLKAVHSAIAAIVVLETIIGGRVVPAFTTNATPGLALRTPRGLDEAVLLTTALGLALWLADSRWPSAVLLGVAAVLHAWRAVVWKPWVTAGRPILWILHASYAWIPLGLAMLAASRAGWIAASPAIHALTVGATGGLIIGMITRTARGHTGRPLRASRTEVIAYACILAAALVRVGVPLLMPSALLTSYVASGVLWTAALVLYVAQFAPWLASTRADGADG